MRTRRSLAAGAFLLAMALSVSPLRGGEPSPSAQADGRLAAASALIRIGKVAEARKVLATLVESEPKNREARRALLEAAALVKDWNECNAQTAALEPFLEGEEVSMFYAAVALRETGSIASARELVKRSRPLLKPSRFVDWYTKEILGD